MILMKNERMTCLPRRQAVWDGMFHKCLVIYLIYAQPSILIWSNELPPVKCLSMNEKRAEESIRELKIICPAGGLETVMPPAMSIF